MASESHDCGQKATKRPEQILTIRHGEKPGDPGVDNEADGIGLSARGYERAAALAIHIPATFGKIDHLFASRTSKISDRSVQTITPLAALLNLKINFHYQDDCFDDLAVDVLRNENYWGERILIC